MSNDQSHGPSPLSASAIPSSFDSTPEFFEEARFQKLYRKLKQEPLIPIGCAATCYALYMATKSIRAGDHHQTNRMFRARIYAQGFTLVALVAGSIFYKDERMQRKQFEMKIEEKKTAEKREKWLNELEARDREDREWRERIERAQMGGREQGEAVREKAMAMVDAGKERIEEIREMVPAPNDAREKNEPGWFNKSVLDEVRDDGWGPGMWVRRARDATRRF